MKISSILAVLLMATRSASGDGYGPPSFCATLKPGMVAFIGTPTSVTYDQHGRLVTFDRGFSLFRDLRAIFLEV